MSSHFGSSADAAEEQRPRRPQPQRRRVDRQAADPGREVGGAPLRGRAVLPAEHVAEGGPSR